jgi:hypothetical protein
VESHTTAFILAYICLQSYIETNYVPYLMNSNCVVKDYGILFGGGDKNAEILVSRCFRNCFEDLVRLTVTLTSGVSNIINDFMSCGRVTVNQIL